MIMRKFKITVLFLGAFLSTTAQDFHLQFQAGSANYSGDLQSKNFTLDQALFHMGLGVAYQLNDKWMLRSGITFAQLNAQDQYQKNELRRLRNLSFATNLWEFHAAGEYHFLGLNDRVFSPYVMLGAAVFNYNPYAYTPVSAGGQKVFLRPLSTEGQGLTGFPDRKAYQLTQIAIPYGAGVQMKLTEQLTAGVEIGFRKTFSDYIDDVSTTYVDPAALLAQRGPLALQMAFRTPEVPGHLTDPYPTGTSNIRGGKAKDTYYFIGATIRYRLSSGNNSGGSWKGAGKKRTRFGCPVNVW
jgi:opacity protein-like surface antigen